MRLLKRLYCTHDYEFVRNIYGDEIISRGWKRSIWRCTKCGKQDTRRELVPNAEITGRTMVQNEADGA